MSQPLSLQAARRSPAGAFHAAASAQTAAAIALRANALARATRAREAFQARLASSFRAHLDGLAPEPSDAELRTFALLAATEHRLEQHLAEARGEARPQRQPS
ncbi:hypothetical protein [Variovorax sp. ZT4R33]|uniref:hypothetical protein n=1 Tax=Variovorax sp. ZT4R33 TaxID=3443743 RepID=UPI003F45131F